MSYAAEACIDMEAMCHSPKQCKYHTNDQRLNYDQLCIYFSSCEFASRISF